ncbi:MAG: RiPP maturation radical SAM protein 1 [Polyangiaceae bacterium]|nr:RiPP maturation radical SAM protein 1 [Polyangiaceae bacterium]
MTSRTQSTPKQPSLVLVAMPWSHSSRPSAGLAALEVYCRRAQPTWSVACRSEFVEIAYALGDALYEKVARECYQVGDLLYSPFLYPEKAHEVERYFGEWLARERRADGQHLPAHVDFDVLLAVLRTHIDSVADELAGSTVIGLTTCFGQLFGNLALARAVKARSPETTVVLGGSSVSARVGPSLLAEYPFVDYVIHGEGELPLADLLGAVARGERPAPGAPGLVSRADGRKLSPFAQVPNLDDLPFPSYDDYAERAERYGMSWMLPLETSRGCWWDRGARTGNPKDTCYFCNLNVQWGGYREKSVQRVGAEMSALSNRYRNLQAYFIDNILRHKDAVHFAETIASLKKHFRIFYELRASIRAHEFLLLYEAGLREAQFGVEGLSTSFLRRINKGTTTAQNLHAMKLCTEFHVAHPANLILSFPGSTDEEVAETVANIESYALGFEPMNVARFHLGVGSTVDVLRHEFGITGVRNHDCYKVALPEEVYARLELAELAFDGGGSADWTPVEEAVQRWRDLHDHRFEKNPTRALQCMDPFLAYRDGDSFLVIEDRRYGDFRSGEFTAAERDVYLFCTEPRSHDHIVRWARARGIDQAATERALQMFVADKLMFAERRSYLSLAAATSPRLAAERIRWLAVADRGPADDEATGASRSKRRLPVQVGGA